jgi:hypothetical protein
VVQHAMPCVVHQLFQAEGHWTSNYIGNMEHIVEPVNWIVGSALALKLEPREDS